MRNDAARDAVGRDTTAPHSPVPSTTSSTTPTPKIPLAATPARETTLVAPKTPRWLWTRQWEFWLALVLAAFLRLWRIDLTQFLGDQAGLMRLARGGVLQGALPLTGIPSSIGTLNPPTSIYLIMPFVAFTKDPLPAVVSIALWNIVGVALCYIFALRYFGRRIAAVGTLLFATCDATVFYSRFLWQQNYLPPLFVLWAITLYAGCVQGRKHWFVANATILLVAALLHPIGALLIPVTIIGIFLAPKRPRLWEYGVFIIIAAVFTAPTLLWEYASGWSDVRLLLHFATGHGKTDPAVFYYLFTALGTPRGIDLGATSLDARFHLLFLVINVIAALVFALGYIALTLRLWRPMLAIWRSGPVTALGGVAAGVGAQPYAQSYAQAYRRATPRGRLALVWRWMLAVYQHLRADASLRAQALLWLWVSVPVAALIHHSSSLFTHYLMVLYPGAFLVAAFAAQDVPQWLAGRRARRRAPFAQLGEGTPTDGPALRRATRLVGVALVALIVAQAAQSSLDTASLFSPGFQPAAGYEYPLSVAEQLDGAISALQRQQGASNVSLITTEQGYQTTLDYLLVSEHPDRVSVGQNCLLLPAPSAWPTLIVAAVAAAPDSQATALLPTLPNVRSVGQLTVPYGASWQAYVAQGATPALPGETPLAVSYRDQQGDALTLAGATVTALGIIRLRWRIDAAPTGHWFGVSVRPTTPTVKRTPGVAPVAGSDSCQPTRWAAGETLFTWTGFLTTSPGALSVRLAAGTLGLQSPTIGGFHFLADDPADASMVPLAPVGPAPSLKV